MTEPFVPPLAELDRWLADRESRVPGLRPGVAAGVVWARPGTPAPTAVSLVYLHGYSATRGELHPVPDKIAAALGANLYYARLTGHGGEGHGSVTVDDWVRDGLEALAIGRALGQKTVVMATSTGGTLAAWLALGPAHRYADATILVSPNLTVKNRGAELLRWPGKEKLLKLLVGPTTGFPVQNELHARYWDCTHDSHSLIPMMELVHRTRKCDFRQWPTPMLAVYDLGDPVVNERVTERLLSRVLAGKATLHRWTATGNDHRHVLAGDALAPGGTERLTELGVSFLKRALAPGSTSVSDRSLRRETEGPASF